MKVLKVINNLLIFKYIHYHIYKTKSILTSYDIILLLIFLFFNVLIIVLLLFLFFSVLDIVLLLFSLPPLTL